MSKRVRTNVHVDHLDPKVGGASGYVGHVSVNGKFVWTTPRAYADGVECLRACEAREQTVRTAAR